MIIVAAGTGSRLGAGVHKALARIGGRPLVEHTLRRAASDARLAPLVLVGHRDDRAALEELVAGLDRPVLLVDGGARRQDSVRAGLDALPPDAPPVVLVHDGARPFFPLEPLAELATAALAGGCALLATPVSDTIKAARPASDGVPHVDRTVPREGLWAAQTPQAFDRAALARRLAEADAAGRTVTDEAALFEQEGSVALVAGSPLNFKITTPHDLALADALLASTSPAIQDLLR